MTITAAAFSIRVPGLAALMAASLCVLSLGAFSPLIHAAEVTQVPVAGSDEDLFAYIVKVRQSTPAAQDQTSVDSHQRGVQQAILSACEALLKRNLDEARLLWTLRAKGIALRRLTRLGDAAAARTLPAYTASLLKDSRDKVAVEGRLLDMQVRVDGISRLNAAGQEQLVQEVDDYLSTVSLDQTHLSMATTLCQDLEQVNRGLAGFAYEKLMGHFTNHSDATIAAAAQKSAGIGARLGLVGRPLAMAGVTVDGRKFDLKHHRGKVVVVEFWATWCGNCVREMPHLKQCYDRHHHRGVEFVGITLDKDSKAARKFADEKKLPWPNLISSDPRRRGWEDPHVVRLGVESLPTVIVVDQKGRVHSTDARGENLDQVVSELLDQKKTVASAEE